MLIDVIPTLTLNKRIDWLINLNIQLLLYMRAFESQGLKSLLNFLATHE